MSAQTVKRKFDLRPLFNNNTEHINYIYLGIYSVALRIFIDILRPGAVYFPDSYDYVYSSEHFFSPSALHPPTVGWIWRIGTLGFLNERNVLIFQGVLGVISVLLLYQLLIQILKKTPSLVISIIYS